MRGAETDPDPSPLGGNYLGALRHRARIRRPAVRLGWLEDGPGPTHTRGSDPYVEVTHETALDLVAGELDRVRRQYGNEAIFGGSYGWGSAGRFHHAQSQIHRFLNATGGYTRSVNTYSHAAGDVVLPHIVGDREWFLRSVPRWSQIADHTRLVVAFGGLPRRSVQINPGGVGAHLNARQQDACARAGVRFVVVSPSRDDSAPSLRAEWLPVRPHTDVAMMLGMAHTLLREGSYDRYFVEKCCVGFEHFASYLRGETDGVEKTARWAAGICGTDEAAITTLARRLSGKVRGREVARLHPRDAAERGLADGDLVRIHNQRGACLAAVEVTEGLRQGVVQLPTGAWYDPVSPGGAGSLDKHGNPNVLTLDIATSKLAQGPSAHTCLVEVERFTGAVPPLTAHEPPELRESPASGPAPRPGKR
ncbi:molybdopterin dinucleotide binding domain-containing protein [Streptomyces sp. AD55]|uniref:molybdopterin dinucleotide binding domain-containing protein n=1 Tax=Streptomyces sp. AD55 TaxID=3242895 RepID=UPI0035284819